MCSLRLNELLSSILTFTFPMNAGLIFVNSLSDGMLIATISIRVSFSYLADSIETKDPTVASVIHSRNYSFLLKKLYGKKVKHSWSTHRYGLQVKRSWHSIHQGRAKFGTML